MQFGDGPWKEGRAGAASLCYATLRGEQLAAVIEHHAAVGIRASMTLDAAAPEHSLLVGRKWDLATREYPLAAEPCAIAPPGGAAPDPLAAMPAPHDAAAFRAGIEAVVARGQWAIWWIDAAALDALTLAGHAALLRWLGDNHARIWCAPVRDIAAWRAGAGAGEMSQSRS